MSEPGFTTASVEERAKEIADEVWPFARTTPLQQLLEMAAHRGLVHGRIAGAAEATLELKRRADAAPPVGLNLRSELNMKPPAGYRKLPPDTRCRCIGLVKYNGEYYCCFGKIETHPSARAPLDGEIS